MGPAAADALSFHHDVQSLELSEFQSHYLAHDAITSAICRNHSHDVLHRLELRMDAGGPVLIYLLYGFLRPWVSKRWRREIEEEIGEEGGDEAVISEP